MTWENIVLIGLYAICFGALIYGSITDLKSRILSNRLVLFLLPVMLLIAVLQFREVFIFTALGVLFIGFLLFLVNAVGAGDVKLLFVLSLAIEPQHLIVFFFFVAIFGALLILLGLIFKGLQIRKYGVPYGVAIALGYFTFIMLQYAIVSI